MYGFNDLFDQFDEVFDPSVVLGPTAVSLYKTPCFPPVDVYVEKDGTLNFNFAVVGYKKDDFEITFNEDWLVLSTKKDFKAPELENASKIIRNNIKHPSFTYKYLVPAAKFKQAEASASMEGGMLVIKIPPVENCEPKKIEIA